MSRKRHDEESEWSKEFWAKVLGSVFLLPVVMWIWPWATPFKFFEFWNMRGSISDWLYAGLPLFLWGGIVNAIIAFFTKNNEEVNDRAEELFSKGTLSSLAAGIFEEMTFRWLFFLNNIVVIKITNFVFFGFLGFGIPEWFQLNLFGPIADWITLGGLHASLFHQSGWAVGSAMLVTNAFFRDGHKYQGWFGYVNSWFGGMFFFFILFKYGLPAAMLIHFLYDFIIDIVRYVDCVVERFFES